MNWVIVRSVIVPYLFKNCIGYAMFRLNRGQEGLMPLVFSMKTGFSLSFDSAKA
jgi:hypothetical protein